MANKNLRKLILVAGAILILSALALVMFHRHADGGHTNECFVCRLVSHFAFLFAAVSLFAAFSSRKFLPLSFQSFTPLLFVSNLNGRAPPTFLS
jgi:RsiW-degrading membrane proteinase PrsW (M82 family)